MPRNAVDRLRALAVALAVALAGPPAAAAEITVFAAASLKNALDAIAADWQARTGERVVVSYDGSSKLARQIQRGAPADIFVSAAVNWMDVLEGEGLIRAGTRRDLLGNRLVLVAHGAGARPVAIGPDLDLAGLLRGGKLSMAMVDAVPAGQYGKEALTALGLWESVAPSVVESENVRAALALVAAGEAPYGIVYASDAVADDEGGDAVSVVGAFPEDSHTPIIYPAAVTSAATAAGAGAFLDALSTPEARAIFAREGFLPLGGN